MRGVVLNYEPAAGRGLIRAADGKRYSFIKADWLSDGRPTVSDPVDFEPIAELATDIYLLRSTLRPADAARPIGTARVEATTGEAGRGPADAPRNPLRRDGGSRLLGDWTLLLAIVSLLATLLPYVSFGTGSVSLVDAPTVADKVGAVASLFGRPGGSADAIVWSFRLLYLLYLIPLLALVTILFGLIGRSPRRIAFWQGLASVALPILVPVAVVVELRVQSPTVDATIRGLGLSPADIDFADFLGIGFWIIVITGVVQLLAASGLIRRTPADLLGLPKEDAR